MIFNCPCGRQCESQRAINTHATCAHRNWVCGVCCEAFPSELEIEAHNAVKQHPQLTCNVCNAPCIDEIRLRKHKQDYEHFLCVHCRRLFDCEEVLTHHLVNKHSMTICVPCGIEFTSITDQHRHFNEIDHPGLIATNADSHLTRQEQRHHYCQYHDEAFSHLQQYRSHLQEVSHPRMSERQCSLDISCGKTFPSRRTLSFHITSGLCKGRPPSQPQNSPQGPALNSHSQARTDNEFCENSVSNESRRYAGTTTASLHSSDQPDFINPSLRRERRPYSSTSEVHSPVVPLFRTPRPYAINFGGHVEPSTTNEKEHKVAKADTQLEPTPRDNKASELKQPTRVLQPSISSCSDSSTTADSTTNPPVDLDNLRKSIKKFSDDCAALKKEYFDKDRLGPRSQFDRISHRATKSTYFKIETQDNSLQNCKLLEDCERAIDDAKPTEHFDQDLLFAPFDDGIESDVAVTEVMKYEDTNSSPKGGPLANEIVTESAVWQKLQRFIAESGNAAAYTGPTLGNWRAPTVEDVDETNDTELNVEYHKMPEVIVDNCKPLGSRFEGIDLLCNKPKGNTIENRSLDSQVSCLRTTDAENQGVSATGMENGANPIVSKHTDGETQLTSPRTVASHEQTTVSGSTGAENDSLMDTVPPGFDEVRTPALEPTLPIDFNDIIVRFSNLFGTGNLQGLSTPKRTLPHQNLQHLVTRRPLPQTNRSLSWFTSNPADDMHKKWTFPPICNS